MTRYVVVDTDVLSYTLKHDTRGELYRSDLSGAQICLSFMTLAEVKRWALQRRWGAKRLRGLDALVDRCVLISFDVKMADVWARIAVHRSSSGRPIETGDCWIAATALRHGLPLITHNGQHYADIPGLDVISHAS